jgi:hypothetical protein
MSLGGVRIALTLRKLDMDAILASRPQCGCEPFARGTGIQPRLASG